MKTLIISDTHFTKKFYQKRFNKLVELINSVDKVIINGDFWDSDHITFDQFVNSKWKNLFPLLKSKNTVYIFGNHDEKDLTDDRVNLFSKEQSYDYKLEINDGKVLYITHGHRVVGYINFIHKIVHKSRLLSRFTGIFINTLIQFSNGKYLKAYKKMNNDMASWAKNNLKPNEILVCGHSHLNQFTPEKQFIDLGHSSLGFFEYIIIDQGKMKIYKEKL